MLVFIRRFFSKRKSNRSKKEYTKTQVLDDMGKILDWQHGKKGTPTRDLYEKELQAVRQAKETRRQTQP